MLANPNASKATSRKSTLLALLALCTLALILRYPEGHEQGVDSFNMHALAGAVVTTGSMDWLVNPLSYFGLAPFSYSPAVPLSTASFGMLSNTNLEPTILAYSLFLGALAPLTAFLLGRSVFGRDSYALVVAFLISNAEGIVGFTDWTLTARGTFLVVVPLVLALFIRAATGRRRGSPSWGPLLLASVPLAFIHAMWILLFPVLLAAWVLYRVVVVEDELSRRKRIRVPASIAITATCALSAAGFVALIVFGPAAPFTLNSFPQFQSSVVPDNALTRIGLQFATLMGLGVLLLPIGLGRLAMIVDRRMRFLQAALILTFLPLALDPVYGSLLAIPTVLVVAGMGWPASMPPRTWAPRAKGGRALALSLVIALAILAVPAAVTIPRSGAVGCDQPNRLDPQTYNLGLYLESQMPPRTGFVADTAVEDARLEAVSGRTGVEPILSVGTLAFPWLNEKFSPIYSTGKDVISAITQGHQLLSVREWLPAAASDYDYYYGKHTFILLESHLGTPSANEILGFYQVRYAVERCRASGSILYGDISAMRYSVYADGVQRVFLIGQ